MANNAITVAVRFISQAYVGYHKCSAAVNNATPRITEDDLVAETADQSAEAVDTLNTDCDVWKTDQAAQVADILNTTYTVKT